MFRRPKVVVGSSPILDVPASILGPEFGYPG